MNLSETTDDSALAGSRYDQVISLGYNCYAATVIGRLRMKRAAMPFDWISTTLPMVQHCIEDDFARLLDRQHYKPVERGGPTQFKHTGYDTFWHTNFTHFDPNGGVGRVFLERAIDRWHDMVASPKPKLFVFMNQIFEHERERYVREFRLLVATITRLTAHATVVGVTITATGEAPGFAEACKIGDSRLFHYTSASPLQALEFANREDDARMDQFMCDITKPAVVAASDRDLHMALIEIELAANSYTGPLARRDLREMLHAIGERAEAALKHVLVTSG